MEASNIKKQIPNIITIIRIFLVIPIIVFMCINPISIAYEFKVNNSIIMIDWNSIICLIIFIVASISDWLDGYLSRKYKWVSDFGKILDPIADKLLINTILIMFSVQTKVFVVFTILFIGRDIIVDAIRMFSAKKNIIIAANWSGKLKTVLQMLAIIIIFVLGTTISTNLDWWYWAIQNLFIYLALVASITSGLIYTIKFIKQNKACSTIQN